MTSTHRFHSVFLHSLCIFFLTLCPYSYGATTSSLKNSTTQLINWANAHKNDDQNTTTIIETAKSRNTALLATLESHPASLVNLMLSEEVVHSLPKTLQPYVEKKITDITGTLEIRIADSFKESKATVIYLLHQANGETFQLHFANKIPNGLKTGDKIKIQQGYQIPTTHITQQLLVLSVVDMDISQVKGVLPDTFGKLNTIVFLLNFQDQPNNFPFTAAQVQDTVFNQVNNIYYESSYHQTNVIGRTAGWFTAPINSTDTCDNIVSKMSDYMPTAASKAGIDINAYAFRVVIFPTTPSCTWGGLGTVGKNGTYSTAWINGYNISFIFGHEMGHNLGLWHAKYLQCSGKVEDTNCTTIEYGDGSDIMGSGGNAHFNAFQKDRLGWLGYQSSPPIKQVASSGSFTIDPYETTNANTKALKIQRDTSNNYYYVEYRQPIGFDSGLVCSGCDFTRGVLLHVGNSQDGNTSNILDLSPNDNNTRTVALLPGQSFTRLDTPNGNLKITLNSLTASGANVSVELATTPPECVHAAPALRLIPSDTISLKQGTMGGFTIQIINKDSAACPPSTFSLTAPAPGTLGVYVRADEVTLSPGWGTATGLVITAMDFTPVGLYQIPVTATNLTASSPVSSVTGNVNVTPGLATHK